MVSLGSRSRRTGTISTLASATDVTKMGTFRGSTFPAAASTLNASGFCFVSPWPAMTCRVTAPSSSAMALEDESHAPPEPGVFGSSTMMKCMTAPGTASPCDPRTWNTSCRLPKGGMATVSDVASMEAGSMTAASGKGGRTRLEHAMASATSSAQRPRAGTCAKGPIGSNRAQIVPQLRATASRR